MPSDETISKSNGNIHIATNNINGVGPTTTTATTTTDQLDISDQSSTLLHNKINFVRELTPRPDNYSSINSCNHIESVLGTKAKNTVFETYRQAVLISQPIINNNNNNNTNNTNNNNYKSIYKLKKDGSIIPIEKLINSKNLVLKCHQCHLNNFGNSMICLQCPHVGCCFNDYNHSYSHYKSTKHMFSIDSSCGLLYCFKCNDFINHPELEKIRLQIVLGEHDEEKKKKTTTTTVDDDDDDDFIKQNYVDPGQIAIKGLKGFVNLGATCFMSSILQTLIHNPLIKYQFFNNDLHYFNCEKFHNQFINQGNIDENNACITCSIDNIFQSFYTSTTNEGFGMTNLLTTAWYKQKSLAGFEEQDAHEFWQFLLNEFHMDYQRIINNLNLNLNLNLNQDNNEKNTHSSNDDSVVNSCGCIMHSTFSFELQSCIKCDSCDSITETVDPMIDLSLEVNFTNLYQSLQSFTRDEKLDDYNCKNCNNNKSTTTTSAIKKLRLKTLPQILSIQLKRFRHDILGSFQATKIQSHINFPLFLNVTEYSVINDTDYIYQLFAVVCHQGSINTGHYTVFIKNNGNWYKFDDSVVTMVSQDVVINSEAYLLYYIV